ncbi:hypothetical protein RRG08_020227 [Elysia crispata]|uniref:Uncharacterized protein n=1 Tax=Elysia crispata TaxID=231223 RepID=A0AAE1DRB4_9GAST|nr:hypothetical protein RRG08_020227 [Elysia crispata]
MIMDRLVKQGTDELKDILKGRTQPPRDEYGRRQGSPCETHRLQRLRTCKLAGSVKTPSVSRLNHELKRFSSSKSFGTLLGGHVVKVVGENYSRFSKSASYVEIEYPAVSGKTVKLEVIEFTCQAASRQRFWLGMEYKLALFR